MSISLMAFASTNTIRPQYRLYSKYVISPELAYPARPPIGKLAIDTDHPLGRHLVFAQVSDQILTDSLSLDHDTTSGYKPYGLDGLTRTIPAASSYRYNLSRTLETGTDISSSHAYFFQQYRNLMCSGSDSTNNRWSFFRNNVSIRLMQDTTARATVDGTPGSVVKRKWFGLTYKNSEAQAVWDNGEIHTDLSGLAAEFTQDIVAYGLQFDNYAAGDAQQSWEHYRLVFDIELTPEQMLSIYNNPYQVVKSATPPIVLKDSPYQPIKEANAGLVPRASISSTVSKYAGAFQTLTPSGVLKPSGTKIPEKQLPITIPDNKMLMPSLRYPGRVPVEELELDWNNPLTRGLTTAVLLYNDTPKDYVSCTFLAKTNDPVRTHEGYVFNGNDYFDLPDVRIAPLHTITFRADIPYRVGSSFQFISGWAGGADKLDFYLAESNFVLYKYSQQNSTHLINFNLPSIGTDKICTTSWTTPNSTIVSDLYINGAYISRDYSISAQGGGTGTLRIGARSDAAFYLRGTVGFYYIHEKELEATAIASLHRDPYQIFKPAAPKILKMELIGLEVGYFVPDSRLQAPELYYPKRKPIKSVMLDTTNPLAASMDTLLLFNSGTNLVEDLANNTIIPMQTDGGASIDIEQIHTLNGLAVHCPAKTDKGYFDISNLNSRGSTYSDAEDWTVTFKASFTWDYSTIVGSLGSASNIQKYSVPARFRVNDTSAIFVDLEYTLPTDDINTYSIVHRSATDEYILYINGSEQDTVINSASHTFEFHEMFIRASVDQHFAGDFYHFSIQSVALSDSQISLLHADLYQILVPK